MPKLLFVLLLTCSITIPSYAQHLAIESKTITGNQAYNTKYIGVDKNGFAYAVAQKGTISFFFSRALPWIQVFDIQSGRLVSEKSISDLELNRKGLTFVELSMLNNTPLLIVKKTKARDDLGYYGVEVDQKLNLLGVPFNIGSFPTCGVSEQNIPINPRTRIIHYKDGRGNRTFLTSQRCFESDTMRYVRVLLSDYNLEIQRDTFSLPLAKRLRRGSIITYNEKLYLALVTARPAEEMFHIDVTDEPQSYLYLINSFGRVEEVSLTLTKDLVAADVQLNRVDDVIHVSGQVVTAEHGAIKGLFTARLNTREDKLENIKAHLFDVDFISRFWSSKDILHRDSERVKVESSSTFNIVERLPMDDGGVVYFIQKNYINRAHYREANTSRGTAGVHAYNKYYYHYTDLIITKLTKENEPEWVHNIPLYHLFSHRDPGKGVVVAQKGSDIYVLHSASNELTHAINTQSDLDISSLPERQGRYLALTKIDRNGHTYTNQLMDLREKGISYWPNQIGIDQISNRFFLFNAPKSGLKKNTTLIYSVSF